MSALPQHLAAYVHEIARRLSQAGDREFVIVSEAESAEFLRAHLPQALLARAAFVDEAEVGPEYLPPAGRSVIVTHADRWQAHKIHRRLVAAKRQGGVVALVLRDRRLQTRPPGWENTGIHYGGMFRLAAAYCQWAGGGSYAEFGVFDGNTFAIAWHALQEVCSEFWAFDSFAGIVGATESETIVFRDGDYAANLATFQENMRLAGVDMRRVRAVKGPFQETLATPAARHGLERVAIAHIDVDVYEPAKLALDYLTPVLQQGALLLFDDYDQMRASNQRGERRAVREWLRENPSFSLEPYRNYAVCGRAFIFDRGE